MNASSLFQTARRPFRHTSAKKQKTAFVRHIEGRQRDRTPHLLAATSKSPETTSNDDKSTAKSSKKKESPSRNAQDVKALNLVAQSDGDNMQLAKIREERYRSFMFPDNGIEFLVSEQTDGRLNLSQTYLHEEESGVIARPDLEGSIPNEPRSYRVLEWDNWISGDVMNDVEEKTVLVKMYLVREIDDDPEQPDLMDVYCLDPSKRTLMKCEVKDESEGSDDPVLRIRESGLVLEDSYDAPTNEGVAAEYDYEEMIEEELKLMEDMEPDTRWKELPADFKGPYDTLFAGTSEEDALQEEDWRDITEFEGGLDEQPDVPEVDNA
ncbi:hypothetical protein BSKO_03752 [Bryopsis sp. KO-2023]|nr:hypothetical protein BSKO_03752 [Bryopsis sp. KO-2023]